MCVCFYNKDYGLGGSVICSSPGNKIGDINDTKRLALFKAHERTVFQKNLQRILFHQKHLLEGLELLANSKNR